MHEIETVRKMTVGMATGKPRRKIRSFGDLERVARDLLIATITRVEEYCAGSNIAGRDKKTLVVEFMTTVVDMPFLPRKLEANIWSLLIDILFFAWRHIDPTNPNREITPTPVAQFVAHPEYLSVSELTDEEKEAAARVEAENIALKDATAKMVNEAMETLGGTAKNLEIKAEVLRKHPGTTRIRQVVEKMVKSGSLEKDGDYFRVVDPVDSKPKPEKKSEKKSEKKGK